MTGGVFARLKARILASTPEVDLDAPGHRVVRTDDGLRVEVDPVAFRKAMRRAGAVVGGFFLLFLFVPVTTMRVIGGVGMACGATLAIVGRPRRDRVEVRAVGVTARVKGRPPRDVAASEIEAVRLEREEYEESDGDGGTRRRVVWPVRAVLVDGTWYLARSGDRPTARTFAEDVALVLGRPFVDATDGVPTVVPADAVNLPFRARARAGLVEIVDPGTPPRGVDRRRVAGGVEFVAPRRDRKRAVAMTVFGAFFMALGFGGVALLVAAALTGASWIALAFAVFPLLFGLVGVLVIAGAIGAVTGEAYVRVEADAVALGVRRFGRETVRRVPFDAFEDVHVARGVRLVSDTDEVALPFETLREDAQRWVATALKAEIARR